MTGLAKRRFEEQLGHGRPIELPAHHRAVIGGHTLFPNRVQPAAEHDRLLRSGQWSRKIGSHVEKGAWRGMPILTLTLEERATCPRSCKEWRSCYGNRMQWSPRIAPDATLIRRLRDEIWLHSISNPRGFVVRLHILGDFFSVEYTLAWAAFLRTMPALRVFGYTAHPARSEIGALLHYMNRNWPDRCAIRFSGQPDAAPAAITIDREDQAGDALICPAQTGKTECCATCALCWATQKTIAFLKH